MFKYKFITDLAKLYENVKMSSLNFISISFSRLIAALIIVLNLNCKCSYEVFLLNFHNLFPE